MLFHSFITLSIFSYLLVQAKCAPQDLAPGDEESKTISSEAQDLDEQSAVAADFIRAEILDEMTANCMTSDENDMEPTYKLRNKQSSVQSAVQALDMEEEKHLSTTQEEIMNRGDGSISNADYQSLSETGAKSISDLQNSMDNTNDKEEEALRNERDLRQALDTEQQLLQLANSPSNELCKENCLTCNPSGNKLRCHNESTVALCTSSGTERIIRCSGLTPICHPKLNVCSSRYLIDRDVSSADSTQKSRFSCPSYNAYYPDIASCRNFYYCANGKPYQYKCEHNEVYNPLTRACALQSPIVPCRRFHCEGRNGRYTTYPGDPTVYALCSNNNPIEMFHCPLGQAMQETNQQCQAHCLHEGLIKDYSSCNHYYECTRRFPGLINSYKITRRSCPSNSVFDAQVAYCVPKEQYPQCDTLTTTEEEDSVSDGSSTLPTSYITSTTDGTTTVTILPMETTLQY